MQPPAEGILTLYLLIFGLLLIPMQYVLEEIVLCCMLCHPFPQTRVILAVLVRFQHHSTMRRFYNLAHIVLLLLHIKI